MAAEEGMLGGSLGSKLKCPTPISRLRVEKIEGGLMVAGVVIAANCQIALPAFGFLFMLVGAVLTGLYFISFYKFVFFQENCTEAGKSRIFAKFSSRYMYDFHLC